MTNPSATTDRVLREVLAERIRQDDKWGEQNHPDGTGRPGDVSFAEAYKAICKANGPGQDTYRDILAEEIYEAFAEKDPAALRGELVQVAAVAVAWIEAIDRRTGAQPAAEETHVVADDSDDTLPEWLYQRFARYRRHAPTWGQLTGDDQSYWAHEAQAVRRAVARNGFKAAAVATAAPSA